MLKSINSPGCIVGKAIYEGKLDLSEAIKLASA
jgi:phosphoribosylformimino-5-aminoimidazole carboxamide ribonucleotide (ProFAR) isomerase